MARIPPPVLSAGTAIFIGIRWCKKFQLRGRKLGFSQCRLDVSVDRVAATPLARCGTAVG